MASGKARLDPGIGRAANPQGPPMAGEAPPPQACARAEPMADAWARHRVKGILAVMPPRLDTADVRVQLRRAQGAQGVNLVVPTITLLDMYAQGSSVTDARSEAFARPPR